MFRFARALHHPSPASLALALLVASSGLADAGPRGGPDDQGRSPVVSRGDRAPSQRDGAPPASPDGILAGGCSHPGRCGRGYLPAPPPRSPVLCYDQRRSDGYSPCSAARACGYDRDVTGALC
jgi:hypothetical protein